MAKVPTLLIITTTFYTALSGIAAAGQLTYRPVNPSFGGDPFNSAHLLGIANANDRYKDPDAVDIESILDNIDLGTTGTTTTGTTGTGTATTGSGVLTNGIGNGTSTTTGTGTSSGTGTTRNGLGISITPNSDGSFTIR
jgi:curli production assembly/transport component CsgF